MPGALAIVDTAVAGKALFAPNANQIGSAPQVQLTARIRAFLKSFCLYQLEVGAFFACVAYPRVYSYGHLARL